MPINYVDERNNSYYVAGTRVSLGSLVHAYLRGESIEGILESFPSLTHEQVFSALAYYLHNRSAIDSHLSADQRQFDADRAEARRAAPELYQRLQVARRAA